MREIPSRPETGAFDASGPSPPQGCACVPPSMCRGLKARRKRRGAGERVTGKKKPPLVPEAVKY